MVLSARVLKCADRFTYKVCIFFEPEAFPFPPPRLPLPFFGKAFLLDPEWVSPARVVFISISSELTALLRSPFELCARSWTTSLAGRSGGEGIARLMTRFKALAMNVGAIARNLPRECPCQLVRRKRGSALEELTQRLSRPGWPRPPRRQRFSNPMRRRSSSRLRPCCSMVLLLHHFGPHRV